MNNKVLFVAFALVTITLAQDYVDTKVIDVFEYRSPTLSLFSSDVVVSVSRSSNNAAILGGESDQYLELGVGPEDPSFSTSSVFNGWLISLPTSTATIARMQYDGRDSSPQLNPTGLGGESFSGSTSFRLEVISETEVSVTIKVSDMTGAAAESSISVPNTNFEARDFYVAFSSFTPATINWNRIGSVQLQLSANTDAFGADVVFDYFGLVSEAAVGPENSICASATIITSLPFSATQDTVGAGLDFSCSSGGDSFAPAPGMEDVWFSFTPSSTLNNVVISTCQSSAAFSLFLATGNCDAKRTCIFGTSNPCSSGGDRMTVNLQAGVLYYIAASPKTLSTATLVLDVGIYPSLTCPPNVSKTASATTCLYSGSIGTPRLSPSDAIVSFSPTGPYAVGSRFVTYTASSYPGIPLYTKTCLQSVNVKNPVGSSCGQPA